MGLFPSHLFRIPPRPLAGLTVAAARFTFKVHQSRDEREGKAKSRDEREGKAKSRDEREGKAKSRDEREASKQKKEKEKVFFFFLNKVSGAALNFYKDHLGKIRSQVPTTSKTKKKKGKKLGSLLLPDQFTANLMSKKEY
jgi:hypothetical protein